MLYKIIQQYVMFITIYYDPTLSHFVLIFLSENYGMKSPYVSLAVHFFSDRKTSLSSGKTLKVVHQ